MATLIATESMIFVVLLGAYFFLRASSAQLAADRHRRRRSCRLAVPFSFVLWGSSIPIFYAEAAIQRGSQRGLRIGLLVSGIMGAAFLAFTVKDFHDLTFGWRDNAYGSIFYLIVGLHALHVFVGLCMNVRRRRSKRGRASSARRTTRASRCSASTGTSSTRCGSSCSSSLFLSEAWR